jgi:ribosomal protein L11 methyltransferase
MRFLTPSLLVFIVSHIISKRKQTLFQESEKVQDDSAEGDKWVSFSVWSPPQVKEAVVNFLVEQTSRGVKLEGGWITAYCQKGSEAKVCHRHLIRYYQDLQQLYPDLPELKVLREELRDEDWSETWKGFFKPIHVGKNIVVKPTWETYEASPGQVIVEIDPGRAFGTGKHPSTCLCIEILEEILTSVVPGDVGLPRSVLDVGTGSGILAVVAARLGARRVLGLDIDPDALQVAGRNLDQNRVGGVMAVSPTRLDRVEETFDVVVANLTASLLIELAADLTSHVSAKGLLLLSGILAEQVEEVVNCIQGYYFKMVENRAKEEWRGLLLRKEE